MKSVAGQEAVKGTVLCCADWGASYRKDASFEETVRGRDRAEVY